MPDANPGLMTLFTEALERSDPAKRAAYLDHACGGNADLRRRVEELLAAHPGIGQFLEPDATAGGMTNATGTFAADPATKMYDPDGTVTHGPSPGGPRSSPAPGLGLGTVIAGRYTLVEVIGEGGMGSVYLASQTEPVKRQVALKLIKTGMDSKTVLARFDAERQALAMMDHPNIARIYDGGVTAAGRPYFVMELVKGVPLTEYCDQKRLPVKARLELFVAVCQAVQHAHQKGIIHRDLKPSNVLVTEVDGRPTPKVIDFGVAKATEQKLTDISFSDTGAIVGTPAYMSPEQADPTSMDIDTRTDVYALGVILYELLTGSPPIDASQFKRGAILEMLRMVREVEPQRPSTKLSTANALPNIAANRSIDPAKLSKLLQGELDWVVMKALEKDRTRRYETANGFARDLQRYLADEVVEARPPSTGYRLRKFVHRHKGQVVAANLVLFALLGGGVGTALGLLEARRERDDAIDARAKEKGQRERAEEQRDRANREAGRANALNGFLERMFLSVNPFHNGSRALTVLELVNQSSEKADATLKDRPLEEAAVRTFLGDTFRALGKPNEAIRELERAVSLRSNGAEANTFAHCESLFALGRAYGSKSDYKAALAVNLKALGILHTLGDLHLKEQCVQYLTTAEMRIRLSQFPEAEKDLQRSEEILGRLPSVSPDTRGMLASQKANLAQSWKSDFASAEVFREDALRWMRQGNTEIKLGIQLSELATTKMLRDKLDEATVLYDEALTIYRRVYGDVHPSIAIAMENQANVWYRKKEFAKATDLLDRVAAMRDTIFGAGSFAGARTRFNLSIILLDQGEFRKAAELIETVLPIFRENVGDMSVEMAGVLRQKGNCLKGLKDYDGALKELLAALVIADAVGKPTTLQRLKILVNVTEVYHLQGKPDRAETTRKLGLSAFEPQSPDYAKWAKLFDEAIKK